MTEEKITVTSSYIITEATTCETEGITKLAVTTIFETGN